MKNNEIFVKHMLGVIFRKTAGGRQRQDSSFGNKTNGKTMNHTEHIEDNFRINYISCKFGEGANR